MGAFEFFFSFYGMVLGLSVAVIATGLATAIQHRNSIHIGGLTLLLAAFVALDIATFWDAAWHSFRGMPYSYGMLVVGLVIALTYFIAAALIFPHKIIDGVDLDEHFWANKKLVLLLTTGANLLMLAVALMQIHAKPHAIYLVINYAIALALYLGLVLPAAFTRSRRWFKGLLGAHVAIYVILACIPTASV